MARNRRWIVPEVVQTSAMDCGPAALSAMCAGFGVPASYGRLREACQTAVDGSSIDTIEDVANALGLDATQVMLPVDRLLDPESDALPAIVVTRLPNGFTHFVVAWRLHGPFVQVMDPAVGRRFIPRARFLADCHVHAMPVPVEDWRTFAAGDQSRRILRQRLHSLGVAEGEARVAGAVADADTDWRPLARLEAAVGAATAVAGAGLRRRDAARVAERLLHRPERVPAAWSPVTEAEPDPHSGAERVLLRGAVLVQVDGRRDADAPSVTDGLPFEVAAARQEEPVRPLRAVLRLAATEPRGRLRLMALAVGTVLAAAGIVAEAALLRRIVDRLSDDRGDGALLGALVALAVALAAVELLVTAASLRLGRRLEQRLRLLLATKIPRLSDAYLHTRPTSDMAERSHSLHRLRLVTEVGTQALRSTATLAVAVGGLVLLDPAYALPAAMGAMAAVAVPLVFQPALAERDLRLRTHQGALGQIVLDGLLGIVPARAHRAGPALLRAHDDLSREWRRTALSYQHTAAVADGVQGLVTAALVGWLLLVHVGRGGSPGESLLFVFLALTIPVLGYDTALALRRWPPLRTGITRLLEPLGAPEEDSAAFKPASARPVAVDIRLARVTVLLAGHPVLHDVDLHLRPGEHVAFVGPSGAGKSTLLGLLLGWARPAAGTVLMDGEALDDGMVEGLRADTVWVDPAVTLWNRSLAANLRYGATADDDPVDRAVAAAGLQTVVATLPRGVDTPLGEGGGRLSGGEGQRVRLGRAVGRPDARLVVFDEPFRGLDRPTRSALLDEARARWRRATFLCATHDVGDTRAFDRVLVVDGGRVVEDGRPADLEADAGSRYRRLLDAEAAAHDLLFRSDGWRRLRLEDGRLLELRRVEV